MANENKYDFPKAISVALIASYPKLNAPDTKFKEEGEYSVKLRGTPGDEPVSVVNAKGVTLHKSVQSMIDQADAMLEEFLPKAREMLKDPKVKAAFKKAKKINEDGEPVINKPYADVLDPDTAEETGDVEFKIGMRASGKSKKTGKVWKRKPFLYDAKGNPLPEGVIIGGGSKLKVNYELRPYCTPVAGVGVSFKLIGVQVLELKQYGDRSAESMGFEAEDGYEATDADVQKPTDSTDEAAATDASDEDF